MNFEFVKIAFDWALHSFLYNQSSERNMTNIRDQLKRQTSNRILTSTVWCSNLGQFVLYSALKLKDELLKCL